MSRSTSGIFHRVDIAHPQASEQDRRWILKSLWVAAPGGILATMLVAWNYSAKPMWRDEWYTYSASERSFSQLVNLVSNIDGGLSVFYFFMHSWMLLGDSIAWMRIPAGASTVVIAVAMALIGRRIGGTTVGVLSGVLVAVLPAIVDHAQEARAYPLVLAAVAGTGLAMLRYCEEPSRRKGVTLLILALIASTLHPIVGAPAVAGIFLGSLIVSDRTRRRTLIALGAPAGAAAAALFTVGFLQVDVTSVASYQSYRTLLHFSEVVSPSIKEIALMALLILVAIIFLRQRSHLGLLILLGWSTVPVATITASALAGSFALPRYVSAAALGIAVLIACGIVGILKTVGNTLPMLSHRYVSSLFATAAIGVLMIPLAPYVISSHTQLYRVDDPRAGALALSGQWRTGDAVVFIGPVYRGLTNFYTPPNFRPPDPLLKSAPIADGSFRGQESSTSSIKKELKGYRRVWLVGLLRQDKIYEFDKKNQATAGRVLVERQNFGEFSLELWQ